MPKVTLVKSARKDNDAKGIKKGDSYYWWKFRHGGIHVSKTPPRPSQLTQSAFWGPFLAIGENLPLSIEFADAENVIEDLKSEIEDIKSELEDKLSNMPDSLQQGPTGETLQGRIDAMDGLICDLDSIDTSVEYGDAEEDSDEAQELRATRADEILSDIQDALSNVSCD